MNQAVENTSKPSFVSLVQLFVCAAALMSCAGYLYTWTHELTSEDSEFLRTSVTAMSTPFGFLIALLWRTLHSPAKRSILRLHRLARPACRRLWNSVWYHLAAFGLFSFTAVSCTSAISKTLAVLAILTTLFQLFRLFRGNAGVSKS